MYKWSNLFKQVSNKIRSTLSTFFFISNFSSAKQFTMRTDVHIPDEALGGPTLN